MNDWPNESRKFERVEINRDVLLICDGWRFPVMARTVNMSEGGYMLITQYAIREGTPMLLYELPPDGFDIEAIMMDNKLPRLETRWCSEMGALKGYAWGLEKA